MNKKIYKILKFITEPFTYFMTYEISDKVFSFFKKHKYILYIISLLLTGVLVYLICFFKK